MDHPFKVSTQHSGDGRFIVPVSVLAANHLEAAEKRFKMLSENAKGRTLALLVHDDYSSLVFPVVPGEVITTRTPPRVSSSPLVSG